jgi:hypothetical protein
LPISGKKEKLVDRVLSQKQVKLLQCTVRGREIAEEYLNDPQTKIDDKWTSSTLKIFLKWAVEAIASEIIVGTIISALIVNAWNSLRENYELPAQSSSDMPEPEPASVPATEPTSTPTTTPIAETTPDALNLVTPSSSPDKLITKNTQQYSQPKGTNAIAQKAPLDPAFHHDSPTKNLDDNNESARKPSQDWVFQVAIVAIIFVAFLSYLNNIAASNPPTATPVTVANQTFLPFITPSFTPTPQNTASSTPFPIPTSTSFLVVDTATSTHTPTLNPTSTSTSTFTPSPTPPPGCQVQESTINIWTGPGNYREDGGLIYVNFAWARNGTIFRILEESEGGWHYKIRINERHINNDRVRAHEDYTVNAGEVGWVFASACSRTNNVPANQAQLIPPTVTFTPTPTSTPTPTFTPTPTLILPSSVSISKDTLGYVNCSATVTANFPQALMEDIEVQFWFKVGDDAWVMRVLELIQSREYSIDLTLPGTNGTEDFWWLIRVVSDHSSKQTSSSHENFSCQWVF